MHRDAPPPRAMCAPVSFAEDAQIRDCTALIRDSDLQQYTQQLHRQFPAKVHRVYNRSQSATVFENNMAQQRDDVCMMCLTNGPLENIALDSAADSAMAGCSHRACVQCWRALYERQPAWFTTAPCPVCRQNIAPFLRREYGWCR